MSIRQRSGLRICNSDAGGSGTTVGMAPMVDLTSICFEPWVIGRVGAVPGKAWALLYPGRHVGLRVFALGSDGWGSGTHPNFFLFSAIFSFMFTRPDSLRSAMTSV
jgi:hypothetical protein